MAFDRKKPYNDLPPLPPFSACQRDVSKTARCFDALPGYVEDSDMSKRTANMNTFCQHVQDVDMFAVPVSISMGFTANWLNSPIWKEAGYGG